MRALANPEDLLQVQFFVKNLFDKQPITNTFLTDQAVGLMRNGYTIDPRIYGASVTARF